MSKGRIFGRPGAHRTPAEVPQQANAPFALTLSLKGGPRLVALNRHAEEAGLSLGQLLSDARPLCPDLRVRPADPAADRAALRRLSDWCGRYTPWSAPWSFCDGSKKGKKGPADDPGPGLLGTAMAPDETGLFLDVTGCAHLFGGEAALLRDLENRLHRFGLEARVALAGTPGAAWALSRHGAAPRGQAPVVALGQEEQALAPLPVAALRLNAHTISTLTGLGLKTVGAIASLPRAPLGHRFDADLLHRLDQALGRIEEPISPASPVVPYRTRLVIPEPITDQAHVSHGLARLARDLTRTLSADGQGARRFQLSLYRVDGHVSHLTVGAARPVVDAAHVTRLFAQSIAGLEGGLDTGFGIDVLVLAAFDVAEIGADQYALLEGEEEEEKDRFTPDISALMDRLGNRLGFDRVRIFEPVESHIPERSVLAIPVHAAPPRAGSAWSWDAGGDEGGDGGGAEGPVRPLALLPCAEPIDVVAGVPEGPPRLFRWRKATFHVTQAEGPERIAPEWWRAEDESAQTRDYYRVEDEHGRRFWLYRHGLYARETGAPEWYLHGVFS